ncbi:MAG: TA0956 family protein [Thermoplasmata archaeon]
MRCYIFMFSLSLVDRSTICVLEDKIVEAVEEFLNIDPQDKWTVEELISKFSRKEPVTAEDVTVGYVSLSFPEKMIEISANKEANPEIVKMVEQNARKSGFSVGA